ncbi:putative membrane protein [Pedobacter sp. SG908]|nr:putative membrane protein [Pedobacter sp. SG908]NMN36460.1 putative membrane protein [Pedobacter sp. SG918]
MVFNDMQKQKQYSSRNFMNIKMIYLNLILDKSKFKFKYIKLNI